MKTRKDCYNNLAELLSKYDDKVQIYKDVSDGDYFSLMNTKDNQGLTFMDSIESDGDISYAPDSCTIKDSSFAIIKTYENGEDIRHPRISNIAVIITNEGFGYLQSILLGKVDIATFSKLVSEDGYVKGDLENFVINNVQGSYTITPAVATIKQNKNVAVRYRDIK